jgi:transformation/transcription domain-associated protein
MPSSHSTNNKKICFIGETSDTGLTSQGKQPGQSLQGDAGPIRAPAPMWRCSKIMHMQRELHPTILNSLEGIVDQVIGL